MNITEIVNRRYSTKAFKKNTPLTAEQSAEVKALLRMSASSVNIQPWHFIIAETDEAKARVAKGSQDFFKFNENKVLDASQVVIFASRQTADKEYLDHILAVEDQDGRYPNEEVKQMFDGARNAFTGIHRDQLNDLPEWLAKQVYLNVGGFLVGVAAMGLDAVPLEGLDFALLDKEFGLSEKGFNSLVAVSVGYRTEDDFNSPEKTPKSRLPESEVFTVL